ncbi:MAG: aminotransferase class I/II-fold pyridoxal phosphate-dependent enzyme, partial [Solirubrobacteraceae bacterium]
ARAGGASVRPVRRGDPERLATALAGDWRAPGVVCVDAVDAATGATAPLAVIAALAGKHGALVYLDDTVGFGVLGERSPFEPSSYGIRGNGTAAHLLADPERLVVVGSLERTCASPVSFLACSGRAGGALAGGPVGSSCPQPVAALAQAIEGLRLNEQRGDRIRARLHRLTEQLPGPLARAGRGDTCFPVAELAPSVAHALLEWGIHVPAPAPGVRPRIHVTAAHTDEQVRELAAALAALAEAFKLRPLPAE